MRWTWIRLPVQGSTWSPTAIWFSPGTVMGKSCRMMSRTLASSSARSISGLRGKVDDEPVFDVGVVDRQAAVVVALQHEAGDVLRRMRHAAILDGLLDDALDGRRERAEHARPRHHDLLADAEDDLCVVAQRIVDQVEMLDHHPPAVGHAVGDRLDDLVPLLESQLVADVDVERVRSEVIARHEVVDRRGLQVDSVVVVRQFQAGKQPLDERRLAGALRRR